MDRKSLETTKIGKTLYLILDECTTHTRPDVKAAFSKCNTIVDYIPANTTNQLQMMDVGVNKPLKDYIRSSFDKWMVDNKSNDKPTRALLSYWIYNAWKKMKAKTIYNSWRRIGYFNFTKEELNNESDFEDDDTFIMPNEHDTFNLYDPNNEQLDEATSED